MDIDFVTQYKEMQKQRKELAEKAVQEINKQLAFLDSLDIYIYDEDNPDYFLTDFGWTSGEDSPFFRTIRED